MKTINKSLELINRMDREVNALAHVPFDGDCCSGNLISDRKFA